MEIIKVSEETLRLWLQILIELIDEDMQEPLSDELSREN